MFLDYIFRFDILSDHDFPNTILMKGSAVHAIMQIYFVTCIPKSYSSNPRSL